MSIPDRDDWFEEDHGLPQPVWPAIQGWMRAYLLFDDHKTWHELVRRWFEKLRASLGGSYSVGESEHFHLLGEFSPKEQSRFLQFLERTRFQIEKVLGDTAPRNTVGKHAVIRFTNADHYYAYIAHYDRDGAYAGSGGSFIPGSYMHIAFPQGYRGDEDLRVLVHELTHNLLAFLPLPPWLNESLAMAFERDMAGGGMPITPELVDRHRAYWNEKTIQGFWKGSSFRDVESQELSYSLASVLLGFIHTDVRPPSEEFRRFVRRADWSDAGQVAAKEHLGIELADLVSIFLGPGNWEPRPKDWQEALPPSKEGPA